jgi:hypothetical protein
MTNTQTNSELKKIRGKALTLNEYIKLSRIGESFAMTRADKREVYSVYLEEINSHADKRASMLKNRLSDKGTFAYNAITKHRDEVMLETA